MTRPIFAAPLALFLTFATAFGELNLSPKLVTTDFDGTPVRRAYFMDGDKKFAVSIDGETELIPQGDGALFRFAKLPLGTVELRKSPIKPGTPFSSEWIAYYAKAARQLLPANAEIWPEEPMVLDPMPINDWKTCRFNFFYRVGGSPVRTDVTFIELDAKNQIVVITGSSADSYAAVRSKSDDIIRRWHEVTPEIERGLN